MDPTYQEKLKRFQVIPGVGPSIARDLVDLGYQQIHDLQGQDPELMFEALCQLHKQRIDRCVLYVFRCAVYFVSEPSPEPGLLKWWNWKD